MQKQLRELEGKYDSTKGNRTAGAVVLLIGILGVMFYYPLLLLWIFLGIIGLLTLITAMVKQSNSKEEIDLLGSKIAEAKGTMAELRAR
jgi:ABC-type bacteriocin/lantibiotic exporter with double-glycine peptidase domain